MTDAKWASSTNPAELLSYHMMKKHPRRLRLLAAGCVRLLVTPDTPSLAEEILDVVERHADGAATRAEFLAVRKTIRKTLRGGTKEPALLAMKCLADDAMEAMTVTVANARRQNGAAQCGLIRCVCGNPYRPTAFDLAWLTSTVVALAQGIYDGRAFDRMPILADALQDANCENTDVLNHCRSPEPHTRGCWVIDGLLR